MRTLLIPCLVLGLWVGGTLRAEGSWASVAHTVAQSTNTNTVTSSAISTTGATLIVVFAVDEGSVLSGTLTDSASNTWTRVFARNTGTHVFRAYYATSPSTSGSHTFTYTPASGSAPAIAVQAWSNSGGAITLEQSTSAAQASGSTLQPGSLTPSKTGTLILAGFGTSATAASSHSINSGFTLVDDAGATANADGIGDASLIGGIIAVNPTGTWPSGSTTSSIGQLVFIDNGHWALVSHAQASSTNNNTVTTTAVSSTTANVIVALVADDNNTTAGTLSDSAGNSWTLRLTQKASGTNLTIRVYDCISPTTSGSHTFTWTPSGTGHFPAMAVQVWKASVATPTFDTSAAQDTVSGTAFVLPSVTPAHNHALVVTGLTTFNIAAGSHTGSSGYPFAASLSATANAYGIGAGYQVQVTTAASVPTLSWLSSTTTGAAAQVVYWGGDGTTPGSSTFNALLFAP